MLTAAANSMSNNGGSYSIDRPSSAGEPELGTDPASGGFFHSDYKKYKQINNSQFTNFSLN